MILPKNLRERAGIREGSTVMATAVMDAVGKLLGLAKVSEGTSHNSAERVRVLRREIDGQEESA